MKKLQLVSLLTLFLSVLLWTVGRISHPLPDWAVRTLGIVMMAAAAALVFATVRLKIKNS